MYHPGERGRLAKAVLAHMPIAKQKSVGTDQPVIVKGLNHRHPFGPSSIISCWGDERKGIVKVDHLRSLSMD
jgi:hypothetical protein